MDLDVVVEVTIHVARSTRRCRLAGNEASVCGLGAAAPRAYALRPSVKRPIRVSARIDLLVAVQTHINEVRREVLAIRPFSRGVGHHESDPVPAQQSDERAGDACE